METLEASVREDIAEKLVNFVETRFGVYLDSVDGFKRNVSIFLATQTRVNQQLDIPIEELDAIALIRGDGPPSSDLDECCRREIHRMTQGDYKKNNSPGGLNYEFAIENCLTDIFNFWNRLKDNSGLKKVDDMEILPIAGYLRALRNRVQHDLFGERRPNERTGPISYKTSLTSYSFPRFEIGQSIQLNEDDLKAIIYQIRAELNKYFFSLTANAT